MKLWNRRKMLGGVSQLKCHGVAKELQGLCQGKCQEGVEVVQPKCCVKAPRQSKRSEAVDHKCNRKCKGTILS